MSLLSIDRRARPSVALVSLLTLGLVGSSCSSSGAGAGTAGAGAGTAEGERADAGAAATTPPPAATVPPVVPGATTVRVHYASNPVKPGVMALRGSAAPLTWQASVPLTVTKPGLYTWSTADAKTDIELKPVLGEAWSRGPNYTVKRGQTIDIYPHFVETRGTVKKQYPSFVSQKLPSTRGIWVYLPPTYLENTEARFGVLYMHDALNLFDASTAFAGVEWKVDETMDAGAEDGRIRETVIVGIESTSARVSELTPTADPQIGGGKADAYIAMIVDEIKPMVDADLRTLPVREETGIMGSSLGALLSTYAGVRRADVFGLVGEMSPSTWWDGAMILNEVSSTPSRPAKPLRVYVDSGDAGDNNDDVVNTTELAARYRTVGYASSKDLLRVVQAGGRHNETYWAQHLPAALQFLLGPRPR